MVTMNDIFQILNKEDISLHKNRDSIREVIIYQIFTIAIIIIILREMLISNLHPQIRLTSVNISLTRIA